MPDNAISIRNAEIVLRTSADPFTVSWEVDERDGDVVLATLVLASDAPASPPMVELWWQHPMSATHQAWHPAVGMKRNIPAEWCATKCGSMGTIHAPVLCLYDIGGRNAVTVALSDAMNAHELSVGVWEEHATALVRFKLFTDPVPPSTSFRVTLRFDFRAAAWHEAVRDVAAWWESSAGHEPAPVPEHARLPFYSTWYSFHQELSTEGIERQCHLAKEAGMDAVIVDDGWQTGDVNRGYAHCGDWEVYEGKFGDFAAHVARVHDMGMKYVLWFSVPFVGVHSRAHARFGRMYLNPDDPAEWHVLDPRFPEVREFLASLYESFVTRYDIDGFKLDFVDCFRPSASTRFAFGDGRDMESVPAAVDRLLHDATRRLRALKPDIMVEFRQAYTGPLMRKYGNMLRAGDVPNDFAGNRIATLDVRVLANRTAVHSDMVMWHRTDPVESAAMQLLHTLFAVPQVSVLLDRLPEEHRRMLAFLLRFWRDNRDVLLDGELMPLAPELLYPVVLSRTAEKLLAVVHGAAALVPLPAEMPGRVIIVNGSLQPDVTLRGGSGDWRVEVFTCMGDRVAAAESLRLDGGATALTMPPAGIAYLTR